MMMVLMALVDVTPFMAGPLLGPRMETAPLNLQTDASPVAGEGE